MQKPDDYWSKFWESTVSAVPVVLIVPMFTNGHYWPRLLWVVPLALAWTVAVVFAFAWFKRRARN